jgi:hypothetical protein
MCCFQRGMCERSCVLVTLTGDGRLCRHSTQDIENVLGAFFVATTFLGLANGSTVQPVVAIERGAFYRSATFAYLGLIRKFGKCGSHKEVASMFLSLLDAFT